MSLDDILSQVNSAAGEKNYNIKQMNYIHSFIKDNDIKTGTTAMSMKYIYALYCEQERMPIRKNTFTRYFKKFFPFKEVGHRAYFRLDPTPFKMPQGWTIWKEISVSKFKYKKSRFKNIKSTPEGWLVYLDLPGGRHLYSFHRSEVEAAKKADSLALFYFGPTYKNFNYKPKKNCQEDNSIFDKQGSLSDPQEKDSI